MKYFTKEWYELMQHVDCTASFVDIPDKDYSDDEIKELYNDKLRGWIEDEKEIYECKPDFTDVYDMLENNEFNAKEWVFVDEKTGQVIEPSTKEEVIANLKKEEKDALKKYNKQKPFNEQSSKREFEKMYRNMLCLKDLVPKWVYEKVDKRLIALGYLPKSVFNKLKEQEADNMKTFDEIEKEALKVFEQEQIPEEIYSAFNFHDDILMSIKNKEDNVVIKIKHIDFIESYIITITFTNATIVQIENLQFGDSRYLYEEIYRLDDGYEVHMLYECNGLQYLTIKCSDIEFKYN